MKMHNSFVALAGVVTLLGRTLEAQSVTRDVVNGDYLVSYSIDGEDYIANVPSHDRVSPVIGLLGVSEDAGVFSYFFRLANADVPPALPGRGIRIASFPCADQAVELTRTVEQPQGWSARSRDGVDGVKRCQFVAGRTGILEPGQAIDSLVIRSRWLPAIGTVYVYGLGGLATVPSGEETPDSVERMIADLSRKGVQVGTVLPARPPASLATASASIQALRTDLQTVCGTLGWLDDRGSCRSLQAKLDAAAGAIGRGQPSTAKNQLSAFRAELDAQHGKHVNDNAYSLLGAIADHTLSLLQ